MLKRTTLFWGLQSTHARKKLHDATLVELAEKNTTRSRLQVQSGGHTATGFVVLPKSEKKERAIENLDVFDFGILDEDMKTLPSESVKCLPFGTHLRTKTQTCALSTHNSLT